MHHGTEGIEFPLSIFYVVVFFHKNRVLRIKFLVLTSHNILDKFIYLSKLATYNLLS
jgi:hypothetical protein